MNPIRVLTLLSAAAAALLLSSCATATPAGRVAESPAMFQTLTESQKTAVMEGRVVEGMTPDAVYLAWGRPDRVMRGSENGKPFEQWRFTELKPVYHTGLTMGMGYGYAPYRYGRRGGYYYPSYAALETGPDYVPVTSAVVRFSRNRVTGWERIR